MLKFLLFCTLIILTFGRFNKAHKYWYTATKKTAMTGVPYTDYAWNYCDMKCVYLEKYHPGVDFVVINFEEASYKPNFSACYVRQHGTYNLWNTVSSNQFF